MDRSRYEAQGAKTSTLHRLHYELKLIKEKQFVDYFLIVADMVDWAKAPGYPCRASERERSRLARGVSSWGSQK